MELDKNKISTYVHKNNISIRSLESQAGLARNTIFNIMHNRSKNPTIENLVKIAKAINCSIDELINFEPINLPETQEPEDTAQIFYNKELYTSIVSFLKNSAIDDSLTIQEFTRIINSIYKYSYLNNNLSIDNAFAQWIIKEHLSKNNS